MFLYYIFDRFHHHLVKMTPSKVVVSWGAASAEMPRAPKRSRELRVVFAVGGCGRFGEVKFQPRSILFWLKKSEKIWMNFLMLQEVLC